MGRMLDALRRIEAERTTAVNGPAAKDAPASSTASQRSVTGRADVEANAPGPTAIPVVPDRSGLFQPTASCENHGPTIVEAASPARPAVNARSRLPDGEQGQTFRASNPFPPASRWWKTPPCAPPSRASDSALAEERSGSSRREAAGSEATDAPESPVVANPSVAATDTKLADVDLAWRLMEEYPPGRGAVVSLCDPEADDVSLAVASLAIALASRVADPILAIDATLRGAGLERLAAEAAETERSPRPGLLDVLNGHARWEEAALGTNLANLTVLPGARGPSSFQAAPVWTPNDHWIAAIRQLRARYRFVLLGIAPGEDAATATLARESDAIYLVIRPGRTGRRAANRVVGLFRRQGGRVAGCILVAPAG